MKHEMTLATRATRRGHPLLGKQGHYVCSCGVQTPWRPIGLAPIDVIAVDKWVHLVSVLASEVGGVRLYLNGQATSSAQLPMHAGTSPIRLLRAGAGPAPVELGGAAGPWAEFTTAPVAARAEVSV